MKSWRETQLVFEEIRRLAAAGRTSALATLVRIEGSSYRRPGAKLLIRDDGSMLGNVSGGCLEEDLRERALKVIASGKPEAVHYETGGDENVAWGLGLGCNGKLDLWLQPAPTDQADKILRQLEGKAPFEFHAGDFVETLVPPPDLVICGAGDDAVPLARLASETGFGVTVIDHRKVYLRKENFPNCRLVLARPEDGFPADETTLVVVKYHALEFDRAWTQHFTGQRVRYLGLLGPKARRDEILKHPTLDTRHSAFFAPIGLDLDAEGPEQIAVSIVAELLAVVAGREPSHLRNRSGNIHRRSLEGPPPAVRSGHAERAPPDVN
jgi:xanthine/CO dehydrogenase XdhC/CoxF family maturation factor